MQIEPAQKSLKVLAVDDTATNRQILQVFLSRLKYEVVMAEDGAKAVEAFEREQPDIVIMDVMMPVMDGYEATRRIKAASAGRWVPVIFLSALDKEENLVAGLDAGGDDYLHKPINFVVVEAKMRSLARALDLQRALDDERKRMAAISDNLADGVITINTEGIIQWCNPAACVIFGYEAAELTGRSVNMLMPEPARGQHDGYLARYLSGGAPRVIGAGAIPVEGMHKNGQVFPVDISVTEMRLAGQRQFVGVVRDTTERVIAENQLRENARRLQAFHDSQQAESALALNIVERQMQRTGLQDAALQHWLMPAANFSGDIVAAQRAWNGKFYVMLGDATGHGLASAICTLPVLTMFYGMSEAAMPIDRIVAEMNMQLCATLPTGYFVAATIIEVSEGGRSATIWSGGTPNLLWLDASGKIRQSLRAANMPMGIWADASNDLRMHTIEPAPGDQLLMCSDGLIEATNAAGVDFGVERLESALAGAPAAGRVEAVQNALRQHMGEVPPHDDVSLLIVTL